MKPAARGKSARAASRTPLSRVVYFSGLGAVVGALGVAALIVANRNPRSLRASNFVQVTNDGQAKQGPIVSDGGRLYFREGASNHYTLAEAAVTGGETTTLPTPLQAPFVLDMAPNRSEFIVGSSGFETSTSATPSSTDSMPPLWKFSLPGESASAGRSVRSERGNLVARRK